MSGRRDVAYDYCARTIPFGCWQGVSRPLPGMHLTAVVRAEGDPARMVVCRPYALLELPPESWPLSHEHR
jgi:hypothetical protein